MEKAERVIEREKTIPITASEAAMLLHMLDNPSQPNAALLRAIARFRQREAEHGNQNPATGQHP